MPTHGHVGIAILRLTNVFRITANYLMIQGAGAGAGEGERDDSIGTQAGVR